MKDIIGFILVIVIILLLLLLAFGLFKVALVTLPACGIAIGIMFLTLYGFRAMKTHFLNSRGTLARVVIVQFNGHHLQWGLEESQIELYANARLATFFSILSGVMSVWLMLNILYKRGVFYDLTEFSSEANLIVGYIIAGIVLTGTIFRAKPAEIIKDGIWEQASCLVNRTNIHLERLKELFSLEASIALLARQLKISPPIDFKKEIQEFVNTHKNKLLTDTTKLNAMIEESIRRTEEYKIHLENINNHYRAAMKLYTVVAIEVNWTGSIPMIKEMEYDYEGLTSENLQSLLLQRKWDDFHDIVNEIMRDLQQLRELAIKYQEETGKEGENGNRKETDEEKAYRIMEISPAVSDEEIKKTYKELARNYHPDNAEQTTLGIKKLAEERFKEINWAYDFLKEIRNIR
ncbi:MAG: J domain-containing protein [Candidatus Brocadiaceae baterium WH-1]|uniref:J domain-containing protein n=1 Tax=Candidatus Loosdrechtia sp. TaxID=3101272 RepID=UPI003A6AC27E|nr:MAG: J domain-containing protein [Candidatus Jettenia sp. AMX2]